MSSYEPWLELWMPKAGSLCLDVGANTGAWTHWLAARFKSVIAIEPNPEALAILRSNLPANVVVHGWAAWREETRLSFTRYPDSGHFSSFFTDGGLGRAAPLGTIELPCRPIDSLMLPEKVDFIKIDTEGAEVDILLGARQLIGRDRPVLLIECHSGDNFFGLARFLADRRYFLTIIRHPFYELYSRNWFEHCWFSATAADNPSGTR